MLRLNRAGGRFLPGMILSLALVGPGGAAPASDVPARSPWRLGSYVGVARHSPAGESWGVIPDRDHLFLCVTGAATVFTVGPVSLAYAPELVPLVVVTNNPKYVNVTRRVGGQQVTVQEERGTGPVWGVGFAPFGLEVGLRLGPRWRAYGATAIGALWFTREVPIAQSRDFNYTWEMGGGLLWEYHRGRWVQMGYKFHHLSNLDSRFANPGLDANVVYVGWQRLFHSP